MRTKILGGAAVVAVVACSGGGSVARFAPCGATDTCPSATVCEAVTPSTQTLCTWSCTDDDFDQQLCPSDSTGAQGVCVSSIGETTIGQEDEYGFCFQACATGSCPEGEVCSQATMYRGGSAMVCLPTPADPLSGTTWTSATIPPTAQEAGVTSVTYTMTFGPTNASVDGFASGDFSATFDVSYGASAVERAGCSETTTITGGGWVDVPSQQGKGVFTITGTQATTTRTGCASSSDDVSNDADEYDVDTDDNGAGYGITNDTMTVAGGDGAVPLDDGSAWTFTKH